MVALRLNGAVFGGDGRCLLIGDLRSMNYLSSNFAFNQRNDNSHFQLEAKPMETNMRLAQLARLEAQSAVLTAIPGTQCREFGRKLT